MPKFVKEFHTPAKLRTFSDQLKEFAASLDAAAAAMETLSLASVESTHANAISLGMKQVDGFCGAIRDAIRSSPRPEPGRKSASDLRPIRPAGARK